jgi:hypothetical protein
MMQALAARMKKIEVAAYRADDFAMTVHLTLLALSVRQRPDVLSVKGSVTVIPGERSRRFKWRVIAEAEE